MGILHYNINVEWFKIAITLHIHDAKMCLYTNTHV